VNPNTTEAVVLALVEEPEGEGPRRGRPRSKERETEILAAAVQALVAEGFDAMTIEGVAAAAGAGKATVYRRWRNKIDLVVDAIRDHVGLRAELVDTGDIRADMAAFLTQLQADMLGPDGPLMATFMAERLRHPELAQAFEARFVSEKRAQLQAMVGRAVAQGDLPADSDIDLLADVGKAMMIHEFVQHRGTLRRDLPERIVRQFFPE
jgi:AcrR family transcriptional regulator